jgi:glycosyltransferase involved in cell wall biosynthesis
MRHTRLAVPCVPGGPLADAVSVFFPMFNEEGNIDRAVQAALETLTTTARHCEVVVVNDGSRDETGAIADRLAAADPRVRVVHHPQNRGYGAALRSGFEAARHPLVVLMDGDNQFDLRELPLLIELIEEFDVVTGYRITRRDSPIRRLNAFMYNRLARLLFDIPVRDVNCGFKVYRRDLLEWLVPELRSTGALINVEMLARAQERGARVAEVGVHHYPRQAGNQTGGHPMVILRAFRELFALWRELRQKITL